MSPFAFLLMAVSLTVLSAGCGSETPEAENAVEAEAAETASAPPATADAAVMAVINGLKENKPQAVWEFLPPSYQKDVNELAHLMGKNTDADVWNSAFATLQKAVKLMESKKDFFMNSPMLAQVKQRSAQAGGADFDASWDSSAQMLSTIVNSEISSVEKLKSIDMGKFLGGTGSKLMAQFAAASALEKEDVFEKKFQKGLDDSKVSVVSTSGDSTILKLELPFLDSMNSNPMLQMQMRSLGTPQTGDGKAKEVEFIKVEGQWVPKEMADDWSTKIAEAKEKLGQPSAMQGPQKEQILKVLKQVDEVIASMQTAETQEDFNGKMQGAMVQAMQFAGPIMSAFGQGGPGFGAPPAAIQPQSLGNDPAPTSADGAGVQVIINGKTEISVLKPAMENLKAIAPEGVKVIPIPGNNVTTFAIDKVGNIEEFSKRITFGKVTNVDPAKRVITVEPN